MGTPDLSALVPASVLGVRDYVYAELRRSVLAGAIKTGELLTERGLAEALGVSTTPVKEAMRTLQAEGLMRADSRRGVVVTFGPKQAEEMVLARASLERTITRLAAERAEPSTLEAMEHVIEDMRRATQTGAQSRGPMPVETVDALSELNTHFHDLIHQASGCDYLSRLLQAQAVYDQSTRRDLMSDADEQHRAFSEHESIYQLIRQGKGTLAENLMFDHVVRSGRAYIANKFGAS